MGRLAGGLARESLGVSHAQRSGRGWRMTGSAVRCFSMNGDGRSIRGSGSDYSKEGGGLGEGGLQVLPESRLADDGKRLDL